MFMVNRIKKYWFISGLALVFSLVLVDAGGTLTAMGKWFKSHHGTDLVMLVIFLGSGLMLDIRKLNAGTGSLKGLAAALVLIFGCAPALAFLLGKAPLSHGIVIGFFIVSVAPTTLSSGVVMTAAAGGNMAHALLVTLLSNVLSVATVPLTLPLLLAGLSENDAIVMDQRAMVFKIGMLVLFPLVIGMLLRKVLTLPANRPAAILPTLNQLLILLMVGVGLSQAREALFAGGPKIWWIVFLVAAFHGALLLVAVLFSRFLRLPPPVKKSVMFMGSQKTLPLTLMIQVSAFPDFPLALVVCVLHHLTQLFMDGYFVGRLASRPSNSYAAEI
jgi:sodium/bile acid cotransporter 7